MIKFTSLMEIEYELVIILTHGAFILVMETFENITSKLTLFLDEGLSCKKENREENMLCIEMVAKILLWNQGFVKYDEQMSNRFKEHNKQVIIEDEAMKVGRNKFV